jgi:hypothetical protein
MLTVNVHDPNISTIFLAPELNKHRNAGLTFDDFKAEIVVIVQRDKCALLPDTTEQDRLNPIFNAIYDVIKRWDINIPSAYEGLCSGNGSHAKLIFDAVLATRPVTEAIPAIVKPVNKFAPKNKKKAI